MKTIMAAFLVSGLAFSYASANDEFVEYKIGDGAKPTALTVWIYDNGPGLTYFAPHDNENTSVAVAMEHVAVNGGKVVQLVHNGKRNVTFTHAGNQYVFDPNRMFTNKGAEASLKRHGPYSQEAQNIVRGIADNIASIILANLRGPIVALHNNTEGKYSVQSYERGGNFANEASTVFRHPQKDPDDFFFVTSPELFTALMSLGFSVVLQNNAGVTDDGSLSVWAAGKGIPYVNVEAQGGHVKEQAAMLDVLQRMLVR